MRVALAIWLLALPINGATITAISASRTDVVSAITSAVDGDTVRIPSGNVGWTLGFTNRTAIALIGSGTNATVITNMTGSGSQPTLWMQCSNNLCARVSGITFDGHGDSPALFFSTTTQTCIRVDHCWFRNATNNSARGLYISGWSYGVIDHCLFSALAVDIESGGQDSASWTRSPTPGVGTASSLTMEDCILSHEVYGDLGFLVSRGARFVFRYNSVTNRQSVTGRTLTMDNHGNNVLFESDPDTRGTLFMECYRNAFGGQVGIYMRGGMQVCYSNTFVNLASVNPLNATEEEAWSHFADSHGYCTCGSGGLPTCKIPGHWWRDTWPAQDQITNSFYWSNTLDGVLITNITVYPTDINPTGTVNVLAMIHENRDYWMQSPNSTNGLPVGTWATYSPFTYPHPLTFDSTPRLSISGGVSISGKATTQ